ncbi:hypothetical protein B0H11DRAFT_2257908 [Mycena galericulata]|nr:hypothetical protein B0H11DRAFT_2257908 [Mycena galericulata]
MLFNAFFTVLATVSFVAAIPQEIPDAIVATRVFKTLTDVAPFIVPATTVFTFTPSPSTSIAFPTGSGTA